MNGTCEDPVLSSVSTALQQLDNFKSLNFLNMDKLIIISQNEIPVNLNIGPITPSFKFLTNFAEDIECPLQKIVRVRLTENGEIHDQMNSNQWINHLSAARDCTEQNLALEFRNNGFYLKTTKQIISGHRLLVWFSDILMLQANLPFLTLDQIKGHRQYRCSKCYIVFPYPNMLKAHLLLRSCCEDTKQSCPTEVYHPKSISNFEIPLLLPSFGQPNRHFPIYDAVWNTLSKNENPLKFYKPNFFPYSTSIQSIHRNFNSTNQSDSKNVPCMKNLPAMSAIATNFKSNTSPLPDVNSGITSLSENFPVISGSTEPLDLIPRSLYSNKNQKGHLCIYCGKLYSRKYGLKIHLRTHTGYKPLKCKICFRPFGDPSNLNKHVRLHAEGDTPYRCEFCGKVLVRRRDLDRHIKSRHFDQDRNSPTTTGMKTESDSPNFNYLS